MQVFVANSERASRKVVANGYLEFIVRSWLAETQGFLPARHQQTASEPLTALVRVDLIVALI